MFFRILFLNSLLLFPIGLSADHSGHGKKKGLFHFVRNDGQWHSNARFKAEIKGGRVYFEKDRFTYVIHDQEDLERMHEENHKSKGYGATEPIATHAYSLRFLDPNSPRLEGKNPFSYYHNFFIGNDPSDRSTEVPVFKEVHYQELYEGIGVKVHSKNEELKYDYRVEIGNHPKKIRFTYEGLHKARIRSGELVLSTSVGKMIEKEPKAYQWIEGEKVAVECEYKEVENGVFGFRFPNGYDPDHELLIDPTVIAATYSGSNSDVYGHTATYDQAGNSFSAGAGFSGGGYPTSTGAYMVNPAGNREFCITKFNQDGSSQIWATHIGGSGDDFPHSMMADSNDNLYILGSSGSNDFPTTTGAYSANNNGGTDIVVVALDASGSSLIGSTYLGGSNTDGQNSPLADNYGDTYKGEVFLDGNDNVFIASMSSSNDFPTTAGVIQSSHNGAQDGVLCKLTPDLSDLLWSTYIGTSGNDAAYNIETDPSSGEVYACGTVGGTGFPTTSGVVGQNFLGGGTDGFLLRMSSDANSLIASSYIGSSSRDQGYFLERDQSGELYVMGQTEDLSMSSSAGAYQGPTGSATSKISFIRRYSQDLTNNDLTSVFNSVAPAAFLLDQCDNIYVAGHGGLSTLFPSNYDTTSNAYDGDGAGFYLMVLEQDAASLKYGTFFGNDDAHVDGGTSRFDPRGKVHETVCASSGTPTSTWAWSSGGTALWDHYLFKFDPETAGLFADADMDETIPVCDTLPVVADFSSNNSDTISYYWDFGNGDTDTVKDPTTTYLDTGEYTVTYVAIDSNTCNISDTLTKEISVEYPDSFAVSMALPSYDPCQDSNSLDITPQFTGLNVDSLVWDMGDGTQYVGDTAPAHTYTNSGSYPITLEGWSVCDSLQTASDTVFYETGQVTADASISDITVCDGLPVSTSFSSNVDTLPDHYWDFGNGSTSNSANPTVTYTDTGSYQVSYIAIDSSSCDTADTLTTTISVTMPDTLAASIDIPPYDPCTDNPWLDLTGDFTGSNADSLVWDMGDGTQYTDNTQFSHTYNGPGAYHLSLKAWGECGESKRVSDTIFFSDEELQANISASPDTIECGTPQEVSFDNSTPDSIQHFWEFGDGSSSQTSDPEHTYTQNGNYQITYIGKDSSYCNIADSATLELPISGPPEVMADWERSPLPPCQDSIFFEAEYSGTGADSIVWHLGDGRVLTGDSADHIFTRKGEHTVRLSAFERKCGTRDSISASFELSKRVKEGDILTPNVFTPNGDGKNDAFHLRYKELAGDELLSDIELYEMRIFNRWGKLVYVSDEDPTSWKWKGRIDGRKAKEATYFYTVKYKGSCDSSSIKKEVGKVTLLRSSSSSP